MGFQENKRIVRLILDDIFCETAYQYFSPDVAFGGHNVNYGKSEIQVDVSQAKQLMNRQRHCGNITVAIYPEGQPKAIKSITAEGNRVVAEYLVHGGRTSFSEDREHNFHVVKVFDFEDDRVVHFHEYCDSYYLIASQPDIPKFMVQNMRSGNTDLDPVAASRYSWGSSWLLRTHWINVGRGEDIDVQRREVEADKQIVSALLDNWGKAEMLDYLSDELWFSNAVDLELTPALGKLLKTKEALFGLTQRELEVFPDGLNRKRLAVTAEENRVVVEESISGRCIARPDEEFKITTCKIFFLRNGKVFCIRQYLDSGYCMNYSRELIEYLMGVSTKLPSATV